MEPDARSKLQQHARDKGWSLFWLEAMDPPQQAMSNANVTVLMLTRGASGSASSFGFLMSASRQPQKQKDRQRECARDLLAQVEQLIAGKAEADLRAWCQVPLEARESQNGSGETDKLKSAIATRLAATGSKLDAVDVALQDLDNVGHLLSPSWIPFCKFDSQRKVLTVDRPQGRQSKPPDRRNPSLVQRLFSVPNGRGKWIVPSIRRAFSFPRRSNTGIL